MQRTSLATGLLIFIGGCIPGEPGVGEVCGDDFCGVGESLESCPGDCTADGPRCGNGECETGETSANCLADCDGFDLACGNGVCDDGETIANCFSDCDNNPD